MTKIILAGQSPWRNELLSTMGLEFAVVPRDFDEQLDASCLPVLVSQELVIGKTKAVDMYLATGDYADKTAGYGVQSADAPLINHVEGDYDTIVSLPIRLLAIFLSQCCLEVYRV